MSVELSILMWCGVLLFIQVAISGAMNISAMGMDWGAGNREEQPGADTSAGRAKRAYMNMLENLVIFAAVVIPVSMAGISNSMTVLGAEIFLLARIVHAIVYLLGIKVAMVRTIAYVAGLVGTGLILVQAL